jgi:hypothetical protein
MIALSSVCFAVLTLSLLSLLSILDFPTCLIGLVPVACCAGTFQRNTYVLLAKHVILISNRISMTQRRHLAIDKYGYS